MSSRWLQDRGFQRVQVAASVGEVEEAVAGMVGHPLHRSTGLRSRLSALTKEEVVQQTHHELTHHTRCWGPDTPRSSASSPPSPSSSDQRARLPPDT